MKKTVLIVGSSAKEYALAKYLKDFADVVVAPGNSMIKEIANCVDIRENNVNELLKFVLENSIDLTVATSKSAIQADIAGLFSANNQPIFAPTAMSAEIAISRSSAKKFLYKQRISTPHFGIYDKLQSASDYLKNAQMPQVITTDFSHENGDRLVCNSFTTARTFVEDLFNKNEEKVVLEDYIYGHEFTFYVITDGYHAVPLVSVANYKFMENGNGGILTHGVGAFVPDYKVSVDIENSLMKNVISKVLSYLEQKSKPYVGILGVDCVLKENGEFVVLGFKPFLSDHDAQGILNIIDDDLLKIFDACLNGTFEDYSQIKLNNNSSVACVVSAGFENKVVKGLDLIESDFTPFSIKKNKYFEYETILGRNFVLTKTSSTLSRARKFLYEDLDVINFDGIKYRTDICSVVENF